MGLDLLDTPIRLTWDLSTAMATDASAPLAGIADRIVEAGVFFVTLQDRPFSHPELECVLESLSGRCQLLLCCQGQPDELERIASLNLTGCQLLLDVGGYLDGRCGVDDRQLKRLLGQLRRLGHEPVLMLTPLRDNLLKLPDLLGFCSENEVARIKLPNAHIGDSFLQYSPEQLPRWQDLESFRVRWNDFDRTAMTLPSMEIHDLFLWEIMTPDQQQNRSEYGGCQAANSLAHVDCHGVVHPCAAWPQPLGRLPEQSLPEIWDSQQRLSLVARIADNPAGCVGCRDLDVCFGGCRGLSSQLNRSAGERDLMCSGPR